MVICEGDCMETKDKVTKYAGIYGSSGVMVG